MQTTNPSNIIIKEVTTKRDIKRFVQFGIDLYKGNQYFCPPIFFDEVNTFSYAQLSPFITKISKPFETVWLKVASIQNYFDVYEENERLRYENNILKGWQNTALKLALEQKELVRSLNYQPVENKKGMIVRVLSEYNSPFSHSVVLEGGKNHGINKGDVLILNNSLFGHVIEVNDNYSRALKLTDYFSRLPVLVGENKELGMMIGDNTENPELSAFQEEVHPCIEGI